MQAFFASFDNTETSKIYQKKVTRAASSPSPSVRFAHCHLSQRERPWQRDEVCVDCQGLPLWGSWHRAAMTERASPLKLFAAAVPLYDPSRENGIPERPQTLRYSEIKNNFSLAYAQSNAERIQNRSAQQKSRRTKSAAALRGVTLQPALCDDPPHTGQIDPTQQMLQYDQHGILLSDRPVQPNSPFSKNRSSLVKLPPPKRLSSGPRP